MWFIKTYNGERIGVFFASVAVSYNSQLRSEQMKCPKCNCAHGFHWEDEEYKEVKGILGEFWELPIKLERHVECDYHDSGERKAVVYGCPSCKIVFHDVE